jgi:hypothetical protein
LNPPTPPCRNFTSVKSRNQFRLSRKGRILSSKHYYLLFKLLLNMYSLFCIPCGKLSKRTKPCFAYFTNYWVCDDWGWYGGNDDRNVYKYYYACWNIQVLSIILEAMRDVSFNIATPSTTVMKSQAHNNNSNILNNYSELKFIGVFLFSLRFPAVSFVLIVSISFQYDLNWKYFQTYSTLFIKLMANLNYFYFCKY